MSNEGKWTPGPWTVIEYGDGDNLAIHSGDSANRICFMATHGGSKSAWERIQADAKVIAAAPELLAACDTAEAVLSIVEPRSDKAEYLACLYQIRAALTKAGAQ